MKTPGTSIAAHTVSNVRVAVWQYGTRFAAKPEVLGVCFRPELSDYRFASEGAAVSHFFGDLAGKARVTRYDE